MMMMQILHLLKKVTPQFAVTIISCSSDAHSALTETTYPSVDQSLIVIVAVITAIYFSNGVSSTLAEKKYSAVDQSFHRAQAQLKHLTGPDMCVKNQEQLSALLLTVFICMITLVSCHYRHLRVSAWVNL